MAQYVRGPLILLTGFLIAGGTIAEAAARSEGTHPQLLAGDRVLLGTVEEVRSDQARINTGEGQPRFIPMNVRKDKGLPALKKGDLVEITVNDQNLLVDVHVPDEPSRHRVVHGRLAGPLKTGHDEAVIRTANGQEESHFIRPVARSKVASVPVGVDAVFLIDELDKIVDVTFGSMEEVHRAAVLWQKKTPLKGNLNRIAGVVLKPLHDNTIIFRTEDGDEHLYEVRPLVRPRLAKLAEGDEAVLLVDDGNKVVDVAFIPRQ
jgi:translation initiation factor IF-1